MNKIAALVYIIFFSNALSAQTKQRTDESVEKRTYTYKQVDALNIELDVYRPHNDRDLRPVIIWIHGGALIFGSKNDIAEDQVKFYLHAGYSVVAIDYRLAPETKMQDCVADVMDAFNWVRKNGEKLLGIDSSQIFAVGHSAGGYLALMTGYMLSSPPKGIVSFYGYGDILADWYNKPDSFYRTQPLISQSDAFKLIHNKPLTNATYQDRFNFYLYCRQNGIWTKSVTGIDPIKNPTPLTYYCPIKNVHSRYPRTLFVHGNKDTDVPYKQSLMMQDQLTKAGIENKLITMTGFGHMFEFFEGGLKNEKIQHAFEEVVLFLNSIK